ncbi:MAG: AlbA family DNA-binding domain-containing protein [Gemmatimonadota bacterium]
MNPEQIAAWAGSGESETLEFKRSTGQRREAARAVCAMLNHRGGRVLFGVEPDGRVIGQQVGEYTLEEVAQELREIDPPAFPSVDRVDLGNGREVLVVSVSTGQNRPYSHRGHAHRRLGNTSPAMSRDEYNRVLLERLHGEHRWENEPAAGWNVSDLDASEIVRTVQESVRRGRTEDPGTRDALELLSTAGGARDDRRPTGGTRSPGDEDCPGGPPGGMGAEE